MASFCGKVSCQLNFDRLQDIALKLESPEGHNMLTMLCSRRSRNHSSFCSSSRSTVIFERSLSTMKCTFLNLRRSNAGSEGLAFPAAACKRTNHGRSLGLKTLQQAPFEGTEQWKPSAVAASAVQDPARSDGTDKASSLEAIANVKATPC